MPFSYNRSDTIEPSVRELPSCCLLQHIGNVQVCEYELNSVNSCPDALKKQVSFSFLFIWLLFGISCQIPEKSLAFPQEVLFSAKRPILWSLHSYERLLNNYTWCCKAQFHLHTVQIKNLIRYFRICRHSRLQTVKNIFKLLKCN